MAPRRRALRDYGDARPLMAVARAVLREAAEARRQARKGLEKHLQRDADSRLLASFDLPKPVDEPDPA